MRHDDPAHHVIDLLGHDRRQYSSVWQDKYQIESSSSYFERYGVVTLRAIQVLLALAVATYLNSAQHTDGGAILRSSSTSKFTFFCVWYLIINATYQTFISKLRAVALPRHRYLLGGLDALCFVFWITAWFALLGYTPKDGEHCETPACPIVIIAAVFGGATWGVSFIVLTIGEGRHFFSPSPGYRMF